MQYKRATPYNSSISQAFMVMSFAAAGLLMSVQVLGDRPSDSRRQASSLDSPPTSEFETRSTSQPVEPSPELQAAISNPAEGNPTTRHSDTGNLANNKQDPTLQSVVRRPAENPWSWLTQPFLSPMRAIQARWADSSQGTRPQNGQAIDKTKEERQATPAIPSVPNSVSHAISQARSDSTSPSTLNQQAIANGETRSIQTGNTQTHQTEHTLAEQAEDDPQALRPALDSSLAIPEPQSPSFSSAQPSTHVNPTTQDSTNQAITTDDQIDQNNIQQEHPTARLVVDLSDRQLAFYQQNEAVKTYPIAVGKAGWETPLGEFTVTDKDPSPLWQHPLTGELVPAGENSPLGSRWIGFWSDGIHQIGFHGTNQAQSIGQAISHGCIRLHDADIQALYPQIAMGTLVIVQP